MNVELTSVLEHLRGDDIRVSLVLDGRSVQSRPRPNRVQIPVLRPCCVSQTP